MYLYELFSHSDRIIHRAHLISSATCVFILCTVFTFLAPFLLTYYTGEFWAEEAFYSEQPRLMNRTKYVLIAETNAGDNRFFMSSYAILNNNLQNNLIPGSVTQSSFDIDGDGLIDQYRISFDLRFSATLVTLNNINVWLLFSYELRGKQRITMETMALINIIPPAPLISTGNQNLTVYGQITFEQKSAIQNSGNDSIYNKSIINIDSSSSIMPMFDSILDEYFTRKYYTSYQTQYTSIIPRIPTGENTITVTVIVNNGRQAIRYRPGFWQNFKWGWIQYVSVLLPFLMVFNRLRLFVFSNHLVRTLIPVPIHRHKA